MGSLSIYRRCMCLIHIWPFMRWFNPIRTKHFNCSCCYVVSYTDRSWSNTSYHFTKDDAKNEFRRIARESISDEAEIEDCLKAAKL